MPHASFGTVRIGDEREPLTFDFGLYGEETFTVIPEPSLGDTFDLYDVPEPAPTNILEVSRACARFIRRMIDPSDVQRFNAALYRIPASQAHIVHECTVWITEQVANFRHPPAGTSSDGRRHTAPSSRTNGAGKRH
jgi:hypothetical protein